MPKPGLAKAPRLKDVELPRTTDSCDRPRQRQDREHGGDRFAMTPLNCIRSLLRSDPWS